MSELSPEDVSAFVEPYERNERAAELLQKHLRKHFQSERFTVHPPEDPYDDFDVYRVVWERVVAENNKKYAFSHVVVVDDLNEATDPKNPQAKSLYRGFLRELKRQLEAKIAQAEEKILSEKTQMRGLNIPANGLIWNDTTTGNWITGTTATASSIKFTA